MYKVYILIFKFAFSISASV